tara:strand:+ start:294 stop:485 length:192 start_codon:yes stop_codon:yes gene_type:complete
MGKKEEEEKAEDINEAIDDNLNLQKFDESDDTNSQDLDDGADEEDVCQIKMSIAGQYLNKEYI